MNLLDGLKNVGHQLVELVWCILLHFIEKVHMKSIDLTELVASEIELGGRFAGIPQECSIYLVVQSH
jgi:hypothetical protein